MKKIIQNIKGFFAKANVKRSMRIRRKNQRTFVYCKCKNEMVGDEDGQKNLSFIRDVYIEERNVVHYKCRKCGEESFFDFDYPCPISLPLAENDTIIERYRKAYYA
jgi:lipopolysaccharide biosynthesis regulator YciM